MKPHTPTIIATAAIGLSSLVMAGEVSSVAPCKGSADSFSPWNVEASLLYMIANGESRASNYQDQDYEAGFRLGVSYKPSVESYGARLIYTNFEGSSGPGTFEDGPDFQIFDLEGFQTTKVGAVDLSYSLGVRFADLFEPYNGGADVNYDGFGPVAGVEATYDLGCDFAVYGNARVAYLFGSDEEDEVDDEHYTYQVGLGVQYDLAGLGLSGAYTRLGYEYQAYDEVAYSDSNSDISGVVLSFGYNF